MAAPMPSLEQIRTIVAIVDAGGFRSAGNRLDLAQPTVSQQLLKLEAFLGAQLVARSRGAAELTRQGA